MSIYSSAHVSKFGRHELGLAGLASLRKGARELCLGIVSLPTAELCLTSPAVRVDGEQHGRWRFAQQAGYLRCARLASAGLGRCNVPPEEGRKFPFAKY